MSTIVHALEGRIPVDELRYLDVNSYPEIRPFRKKGPTTFQSSMYGHDQLILLLNDMFVGSIK